MIHFFVFVFLYSSGKFEMNGSESCCPLKQQEISTLRHDWVCLSTVCTSVTYSNKKQKPIKWKTDSKTCFCRSPSVSSLCSVCRAPSGCLQQQRQVNHGAVTLEHGPESWCKFTRKQTFSPADFCDWVFFVLMSCLMLFYFNSHFLFQSPISTCVFTALLTCAFHVNSIFFQQLL